MSSFLTLKKEAYMTITVVIKDDTGVEMMTSIFIFLNKFLKILCNLFLFLRDVKEFFTFILGKINTRIKIGQIVYSSVLYGVGL
ncbi:hypothetical protein C4588_02040 [Candidatus Parcubacteria bacterium]|nr:MAG: hypothetical protein C4588_02040 [Candidatus Parcubacteria bacterium]